MTDKSKSAKPADDEQVHDQGTDKMPAGKVANAAAETLHGEAAQPEHYEQSDATVLPGGSTLIADEAQSGERTGK